MFKSVKNIFIIAILIRLLIIPFFYHPDIKSQHFHFQFLSSGIFNIYEYLGQNKNKLPYQDTFNYLPLTYYTFGSYQSLAKPILGNNFYLWLNDWGENQNNYPNMIFFMFILKLPYLFFDLFLGYILYKIYNSKKILYLWLFNPISIYLIYILGNFDIIPAFLTVLSFYFIKKNKLTWSYLSIGLAIALKIYPIMFLPFIIFYDKKNIFKNIKFSLLAFLPLIISVLPFIFQNSFYTSFLGSGLTQKILEYKILNIPVFPIFYLTILINYFFSKSVNKFENAFLYMFLIFIGLVKFHPQWIMWFFPFLLIIYTKSNKFKYFLISFFILIFSYIILFNDNYLFWGHLIPIESSFVSLTSPFEIIKLRTHFDPATIQNQIHQILLVLALLSPLFYERKK